MIFQQPMTSLNPSYKIGEQIGEAIDIKEQRSDSSILSNKYETNQPDFKYSKNKFLFGNLLSLSNLKRVSNRKSFSELYKKEIVEILKLVRIPDPSEIVNRYPHELSGGMMQRVMIAMALSQKPSLLIADEPTTSLDVTTQAQILRLMKDLMNEIGTSILLITHDLSIAAEIADRINVMYGGQLIEESTIYDLFSKPLHPYTQSLLNCIPSGFKGEKIMKGIPGSVPLLHKIKNECQFAGRCSKVMPKCSESKPDYLSISKNHKVGCFLYE
jgi:oligopeptide/dipeptide ABC transporter ATP-binding protein